MFGRRKKEIKELQEQNKRLIYRLNVALNERNLLKKEVKNLKSRPGRPLRNELVLNELRSEARKAEDKSVTNLFQGNISGGLELLKSSDHLKGAADYLSRKSQ